ncbi:helix-turn-helix domain-containing protein [Streptomyces uncialis]|uniref:helix-turn-helix domain-containing protein n=1 Tax=Streptomyces uncialis TaxID=1048205 RepID=UPI0037F1CD29
MSAGTVRLQVGTRMLYDGEAVEVIETVATMAGNEVVLKDRLGRLLRVAVKELLFSDRAQVVPDSPGLSSSDDRELNGAVLALFAGKDHTKTMAKLLERAEHVREIRTGYKSGSAELAASGEPRPEYAPDVPYMARYEAKAAELGLSVRTICRWVAEVGEDGEAGLAPPIRIDTVLSRCDQRWVEVVIEVMVEHADDEDDFYSDALEDL